MSQFASDLWKWATKQEIIRDDGGISTSEQDERIFFAQLAQGICKYGLSLEQTNAAILQLKKTFEAALNASPFWLRAIDAEEFTSLQILGECAPEVYTPAEVVATQVAAAEEMAKRRSTWWIVGAAVGGAALVAGGALLMWPRKKSRRRRRRLR